MLRVQKATTVRRNTLIFIVKHNLPQVNQGLADSLEETFSMRKVLFWTLKKTENWNSNHLLVPNLVVFHGGLWKRQKSSSALA